MGEYQLPRRMMLDYRGYGFGYLLCAVVVRRYDKVCLVRLKPYPPRDERDRDGNRLPASTPRKDDSTHALPVRPVYRLYLPDHVFWGLEPMRQFVERTVPLYGVNLRRLRQLQATVKGYQVVPQFRVRRQQLLEPRRVAL